MARPQPAPRGPARAARKEARKEALRLPRGQLHGSPARAPPGLPMTSPSASATMPRGDARRALSAISPTCICFGPHPRHQCTSAAAKAADTQGANA